MVERSVKVFQGQPLGENYARGSSSRWLEDLQLRGYVVLPPEEGFDLNELRFSMDKSLDDEESQFGKDQLEKINDLGVVRNPFMRSKMCRARVFADRNLDLCRQIFGRQFILHVNRYVISDPKHIHPAAVWHREPPYNNFIAHQPMALTFIFLPDGSNVENSGICLLPGSHKWPNFPSDDFVIENMVTPRIEIGSTLVIDSNLFHKGGEPGLSRRRSIVSIFSSPVIKQQTNIAGVVRQKYPNLIDEIPDGKFLLGIDTEPKFSDQDYRLSKLGSYVRI